MSTSEAPSTVRHPEAAWGDRADRTLFSAFYADGVLGWEELPARRIPHHRGDGSGLDADVFEICCIPFFSTPERLGAIVEIDPGNPDVVKDVLELGLQWVSWAVCAAEAVSALERELSTLGWLHERLDHLVAISVPPLFAPRPEGGEFSSPEMSRSVLEQPLASWFADGAIRWVT